MGMKNYPVKEIQGAFYQYRILKTPEAVSEFLSNLKAATSPILLSMYKHYVTKGWLTDRQVTYARSLMKS